MKKQAQEIEESWSFCATINLLDQALTPMFSGSLGS
jgi:hypothetical protein